MSYRQDVVVIGGGQAGLAVSYYLAQADREHVVLERDRVGESWRSQKWDSFSHVTPNWGNRLPGFTYEDCDRIPDDPDVFLEREQIVDFLEAYVEHFDPPVRCGVEVTAVRERGSGFDVETSVGTYETDNVIVATGPHQDPYTPSFHSELPPSVRQVHSSRYQNPDQLGQGGVLVVGSGQSGTQIAEELLASGRDVYLSVSSAKKMPRRYRGRDIIRWLDETGRMPVEALDSPGDRFGPNPHFTGADGGREIDLVEFRDRGATLLGRTEGVEDGRLVFADDLGQNLRNAYEFYNDRLDDIDAYIDAEGIDAPAPDVERPDPAAVSVDSPRELDLASEGIESIVWGTGYQFDFSWVEAASFDEWGYPLHERGVTATEGLYFLGLEWQYDRTSAFLRGVGRDAKYVAEHVVGDAIPVDAPYEVPHA